MEDNKLNFIIPSQEQKVEQVQPKAKSSHIFSNINFEDKKVKTNFDVKVIGIGGAGCNIIQHIAKNYPTIVDNTTLYAFNTDLVSLKAIENVDNLFLLNKEELKGYGSASNPEVGKAAVDHDADVIKQELVGTDILFLVAGMGKGTGSGGCPELASIAKELDILTISIVNMPSVASEGDATFNNAFNNLQTLINNSDSVSTISNDKIIANTPGISFYDTYQVANDQIANIINDIVNIMFKPGVMNINFANLRSFFTANKNFMCDRVSIDLLNLTPNKIKDAIAGKIKQSLTDVNIKDCRQIITNISLSKEAPTTILSDVNKAFVQITNKDKLAIITGVGYNDNKKIDISYLVAGETYTSGFDEAFNDSGPENVNVEPTIKLEAVDDPDAKEYDNLMKDVIAAATPTEDIINQTEKKEEN